MHAPPKNRKRILSLFLLLVLLLVMAQVTAQRQGVTVVEEAFLTVMAPVQGVFQRLTDAAESILAAVRNYRELLAENERMKKQLTSLALLEVRLNELRKENNRLRRMLDFEQANEYDLIPAQVIARNPYQWFNTITINRGSRHGVERNMAVITVDGLIGSVSAVSPLSSHVLLLTDSGRAVSSIVQRSREPGLVEGNPGQPGSLRLYNLPRDANIQTGDTVISSGQGGIFPGGLLIGYVRETGEESANLLKFALLQPAADFNRLEEVFVVVSLPPESASASLPGGE